MGFGESKGGDVVLYIDDEFDPSSTSRKLCKICHEEEDENSTSMESPCACSGTLKFAHRGCIQKWCNEKGNTVCELCLQKFEPGYTVPPKFALLDIAVTIRGSLEVPRVNYETDQEPEGLSDDDVDDESDSDDCSSPSPNRAATYFKSLALLVMIGLLFGHFLIVLFNGQDHYPMALALVCLLRATGILVPFYIVMKVAKAIRRGQQQQRLLRLRLQRRGALSVEETEEFEV